MAAGFASNSALNLEKHRTICGRDKDCEILFSCAYIFQFWRFQLVRQKATLLALHVLFLSWWRTAIVLGDAYN